MAEDRITRRDFGMALSAAVGGIALPTMLAGQAQAADTFREGLQIGAMGALRTTLSAAAKQYDLAFDAKDFRDSTSVLLAIEQGGARDRQHDDTASHQGNQREYPGKVGMRMGRRLQRPRLPQRA